MSLKVKTLYSVPYAQTTETIQAPEFWNAYQLSSPTRNEGYIQAYMHVNGLNYSGIVVPYSSNPPSSVPPLPMMDTYWYNRSGSIDGELYSDFANYPNNFPYMSGYYWDDGRQTYRNFNAQHPNHYSFEFWDPSTLSYHEVDISWKLRDEHNVIRYWPEEVDSGGTVILPSETHTYQGYEYYDTRPVKTNDLYFTFLDGAAPNRYIMKDVIDGDALVVFRHDEFPSNPGNYTEGYFEAFVNPYASVISRLNDYFPSWSGVSETWHHYCTSADEAARAYPSIVGIHRNLDDPNKNWVGTLTMGAQNQPLWALGLAPSSASYHTYQIKGCALWNDERPRDMSNEMIYMPNSFGPFGNWLVRLQPVAPLLIQNFPIQQRIYTVNKSIEVSFDDTPPGPTINP